MRLTPSELERLTIFTAAELARKRRGAGLRLNHPEAVALICDEMLEAARAGYAYRDVVERGMTVLRAEDVLDGVESMVSVRVEIAFDDGTRLVVLEHPIRDADASGTDAPR